MNKRDAVALAICFLNQDESFDGASLGQDIPPVSLSRVAEEVKECLMVHWEPNTSGCTQDNPGMLTEHIHVLAGHETNVWSHILCVIRHPLAHRRASVARVEL